MLDTIIFSNQNSISVADRGTIDGNYFNPLPRTLALKPLHVLAPQALRVAGTL